MRLAIIFLILLLAGNVSQSQSTLYYIGYSTIHKVNSDSSEYGIAFQNFNISSWTISAANDRIWCSQANKVNIYNTNFGYIEEFVLDHTVKSLYFDNSSDHLYWTDGDSTIYRKYIDDETIEIFGYAAFAELTRIVFDIPEERLFWRGINNNIVSSKFDGSAYVEFPPLQNSISDFGIDRVNQRIYFSDFNQIYRCNYDGSGFEQITPSSDPGFHNFVLDPQNGKIYYSNINDEGFLLISDLDGSNTITYPSMTGSSIIWLLKNEEADELYYKEIFSTGASLRKNGRNNRANRSLFFIIMYGPAELPLIIKTISCT